jgi:hypothetical protein
MQGDLPVATLQVQGQDSGKYMKDIIGHWKKKIIFSGHII